MTPQQGGSTFDVPVRTLALAVPLPAIDDLVFRKEQNDVTIRATKKIDPADPYLSGHFPQITIYPGVFIIESLRQAVAMALVSAGYGLTELRGLRSVRFLVPLLSGSRLTLQATIRLSPGARSFEVKAICSGDDGGTVAHVSASFDFGDDP